MVFPRNSPGRVLLALSGITALVSTSLTGASAWSNGGYSSDVLHPDYGTHDWIADAALELQTRDTSFLTSTYHTDFLLGTEAPDNPSYIGDSLEHHVYYWSSHSVQDDSAALRASAMYGAALEELKSGDQRDAALHIGAMTHYIADVGVFGHTMGSGTDWGSEAVHQDYENNVDSEIVGTSFPSLPLVDTDAYNATLGLALKITFGSGSIKSNVWMDDSYDWAEATYRASAFASVNEAVSSVAGAINHLLIEWGDALPADNNPDSGSPAPSNPGSGLRTAVILAVAATITAAAVILVRRFGKD